MYECHLEDGQLVDSSKEHEGKQGIATESGTPGVRIHAGTGAVIEGWDMALLTMRLGEKADVFITSKYAFGDEGRPPRIPPKANVIFTIEVMQVGERKSQALNMLSLSNKDLMSEAAAKK